MHFINEIIYGVNIPSSINEAGLLIVYTVYVRLRSESHCLPALATVLSYCILQPFCHSSPLRGRKNLDIIL